MKIPTRLKNGGIRFNLTPMIDVVFLLIIFFLVASYLAGNESNAALELSKASTAPLEQDDARKRIVVTVELDESLQLAGKKISAADFEQLLESERIADSKQSKPAESLEVRIRADRRVPYRVIEPLLIACARAGITKIKFNVLPIE